MTKTNDTISPDAHLSSLKDFSKQVRNRTIFFILFNVYAFLNVVATTDKDIFLLNPIKMPLLNIELPLIAFYIIIPLILVSLHFNLMYKLLSYRTFLERSLKDYKQAIDSLPFGIYEEILLGKGLFLKNILKIFFFFITYLMPIIVLLTFWYRFADYHDFVISSYHLLLAFASFVVAFYFVLHKRVLRSVIKTDNYLKIENFIKKRLSEKYFKILSKLLRWFVYYVIPLILVSILVWAFIYPYHLIIKEVSKDAEETINEKFIEEKEKIIKNNFKLLTARFGFIGKYMERPVLNVSGEILVKGVDKEILGIIREFKDGDKPLLHYVLRTDYSGRNFTFANLRSDIFVNVNLDKANLYKAFLRSSILYNVSLKDTNLLKANLSYANLLRPYFNTTNLSRAILFNVNTSNTNLPKVYLFDVNMSGSYLTGVNLSKSYLKNINLSRAYLSYSNLISANLKNVNLVGAFFWDSNLSGANIHNANLSGANLKNVNLFGVFFEKVSLRGACSANVDCNKPMIKIIGKKTDLRGIKNEILTEERIKEIIKNWEEANKEKFPRKWEKLLYKYKGKTTIEWIKAQSVDLGEFTEEDLREFLRTLILGLNKDDFMYEFKAYIKYLIENNKLSKNKTIGFIKNFAKEEREVISSLEVYEFGYFFKDQAIKLLDEMEKELIEEYSKN